MISRSDWEPLPKPTLSPFARGYLSLCRFFTAAVWCVPALRVPLVHSLINHFRQINVRGRTPACSSHILAHSICSSNNPTCSYNGRIYVCASDGGAGPRSCRHTTRGTRARRPRREVARAPQPSHISTKSVALQQHRSVSENMAILISSSCSSLA